MFEMPMQIRLNKDQRRRAVMVKGQKRLCGPALTSTVPPVDGNNGFAPMLSASYWKHTCQQRLSAAPLADLKRLLEEDLDSGAHRFIEGHARRVEVS